MCSIKLQKTCILDVHMKVIRLENSHELFKRFSPARHLYILFTDEKLFTVDNVLTGKITGFLLHRLRQLMGSAVTSIIMAILLLWWFGPDSRRQARHLWFSWTRMSRSVDKTTRTTFWWRKCYPGAIRAPIDLPAGLCIRSHGQSCATVNDFMPHE